MPGVPPDAMNNLKKAFKGLFKRSKKSKDDQSTPQSSQSAQPTTSTSDAAASTAAESTSTPTTSAAAPQLPPVQSSSPLQSPEAEEPPKALPPTHPLATGPRSQPQEAVPINHDAQPGPPAAAGTAGTAPLAPIDTADLIRGQEKSPHVISDLPPRIPVDTSVPIGEQTQTSQAVDSAAVDGMKDDLSPALQNSATTALPQTTNEHIGVLSAKDTDPVLAPLKTDGALDAAKTEDKPVTDASLPHPVGGEATSKPVTDASLPQPVGGQPATNGESTATTTKSAPGMSATSGPLEDFPEGGGVQDEHHI